eukprot:PhM_4_TR3265/c0_g1_i1/m.61451
MLRRTYRSLVHKYSSYFSGNNWANQMYHPASVVRPRSNISNDADAVAKLTAARPQDKALGFRDADGEVSWPTDPAAAPEDVVTAAAADDITKTTTTTAQRKRNYVPLAVAAKLELKADYMCESGGAPLAQKALEYLGVVVEAYKAAYGETHNQYGKVLVKLSRAFRLTGRVESALATAQLAERVVMAAEPHPVLEHVLEARLEQGLALRKLAGKVQEAGAVLESTLGLLLENHDLGNSERYTRLIARATKKNQMNFENKYIHYSAYDHDRCFTIVDQCLEYAEQAFMSVGDTLSAERVLTGRSQMHDTKDFNRRMYAGKVTTVRGRPMWRLNRVTSSPTPDELLRYTPTVHQVYFDWRFSKTAPLGKEDEVWAGDNRIVENGDPYRRRHAKYRPDIARRTSHEQELQNCKWA